MRPLHHFLWLLAAALSAFACRVVAAGPTPIDRALPFVALIVTLLAWSVRDARIATFVPLLMVAEIAVADEHTRLLFLGAIVAAAFAVTTALAMGEEGIALEQALAIAGSAVVLLRWIPFANVVVWRELLLLAGTLAIVSRERSRRPLALAAAVALALVTPAHPARMLLTPLVVAVLPAPCAILFAAGAFFVRPPLAAIGIAMAFALLAPLLRWKIIETPLLTAAAVALMLFPWSGVVARGPAFFFHHPSGAARQVVGIALAPSQSLTIDLPPGASKLVLFGANAARFRRGTLLGRISHAIPAAAAETGLSAQPVLRSLSGSEGDEGLRSAVRIGDVADWGYMRASEWFSSGNVVPRDPVGRIRGYGFAAWAEGAGAMAIPRGATSIRVTADPHLPPQTRLQVDSIESERP